MKYVISLFCAFTLCAVAALAQDSGNPPVQHFVISGSAAGYENGKYAVSIASTGFQLTQNVSLAYEFISNPSDSSKPRFGSGVANYTRQLSSFVPAKLQKKLLVDTSNYLVTFQAGAGRESDAGATVGASRTSHIVGNFGIYGGRQVAPHAQLGLGYKFIVGPHLTTIKIPVGNLTFTF